MAYTPPGRQYSQKEFLVGAENGATWGVPVDVSAKTLDFVESINFPIVGPQRIADPGIGRKLAGHNPPLGKIDCKGDIAFTALTYGQITKFWAACFGKDTVTTVTGTARKHTLSIEATLWGKFVCLAYLMRGNDVTEFPSIKFHQFEMSAEPGAVCKGKFTGIANFALNQIDDTRAGSVVATDAWTPTVSPVWVVNQWVGLYVVVDASSTPSEVGKSFPIASNTATACTATGMSAGAPGATSAHIGALNAGGAGGTFATTASEEAGDRLIFDDVLVRLGTAGTGGLTSADDFNCSGIKIQFERPMTGDYRSASTTSNPMAKHSVWEPRDTDICKLSWELTFPNYDDQVATILKYWISTAPQSRRLEIVFTSPLLADSGGTKYSWSLIIPSTFINGSPITLPQTGGVPVTIKGEATLWSDGTTAPTIEIVNKETTAQI